MDVESKRLDIKTSELLRRIIDRYFEEREIEHKNGKKR